MKKNILPFAVLLPAAAMLILLAKPEAALAGASEGLELCLRSVIPALLPFFVLSVLLTNALAEKQGSVFKPLGKLCSIPFGQEQLFLIGLLCGYPVGAQNVYRAYATGHIDKENAKRMLGFCNNAGPSFIFGVTAFLFSQRYIPWLLWAIQILSALFTGVLLPPQMTQHTKTTTVAKVTLPEALTISIKALVNVCGWVILFRTVISIMESWFLYALSEEAAVTIIGLLELTNGCTMLQRIPNEGLRFVLCSVFLTIGGLCVWMQTASATKELGIKTYIAGKLLQSSISALAAFLLRSVLFPVDRPLIKQYWIPIAVSLIVCLCIIFFCHKKAVAFYDRVVYNKENAA